MPLASVRAEDELPRAGAPRPVRLISSDGSPLDGSPRDVAWERRGGGIFFTLERDGTRNIWRAFPDPRDDSRFPVWRALPVTELRAPHYAAQPCPLPGDRALVCVSNALSNAPVAANVAQIVRYDLENAEFRALSDGVRFYQSPQVSPDGTRAAFAGGSGVDTRVFVAPTENPLKRVMPEVTHIAQQARRPIWLDNDTLLVESLTPQARGLYQMPASGVGEAQVVVSGGGEAYTLGTNGIVFSAKTARNMPPNLYVVSRDGSGLRLLAATTNARHPATSPDGSTLAYDAPHNENRALWLMPLLRVENHANALYNGSGFRLVADDAPEDEGPSAQLSSVRASAGGVAIIGNVRGATDSNVNLEVGEGGKPRRWETLRVPFPLATSPLDAQGNRVLAVWNPPPRARGEWTLRLSLRGLGGGAQSLLRVRLPLPATTPQIMPPIPAPADVATANVSNGNTNNSAGNEPLPRATPLPNPPDITPVRGMLLPLPPIPATDSTEENGTDLPEFPTMQTSVPPFRDPLPAPVSLTPQPIAPAQIPTTAGVEIVPIDPSLMQTPAPVPASLPLPTAPLVSEPQPMEAEADYGEIPDAPAGTPFVAQFNVTGTPARMAPREKIQVKFWGWNRGTAPWESGSNGENRVRLVARWVDFSTGTRRQWNYFWLNEAVAPNQRTQREFDLPAPARVGKYKLIYSLVRLPASGEYKSPAYNQPQEIWPNEFGAIAFAVEVAPG